jgi:hypothetical protein
MAGRKKKLTTEQRRHKARRQKETMIIFVNGKQKRVRRPHAEYENIEDIADLIWLHQNEMWDVIFARENQTMENQSDDEGDIF